LLKRHFRLVTLKAFWPKMSPQNLTFMASWRYWWGIIKPSAQTFVIHKLLSYHVAMLLWCHYCQPKCNLSHYWVIKLVVHMHQRCMYIVRLIILDTFWYAWSSYLAWWTRMETRGLLLFRHKLLRFLECGTLVIYKETLVMVEQNFMATQSYTMWGSSDISSLVTNLHTNTHR